MSQLFKFTVGWALVILAIAVFFHMAEGFPSWWLGVALIFSLPLLWTLWLCCAVLEAKKPVWRLVALWGLIDVTVLAVLSLAYKDAAGRSGPSGDEFTFLIAFSPIFLPAFLATFWPIIDKGLAAIASGAAFVLLGGNTTNTLFSGWISFSIVSAIPSFIFGWLLRFWRQTIGDRK